MDARKKSEIRRYLYTKFNVQVNDQQLTAFWLEYCHLTGYYYYAPFVIPSYREEASYIIPLLNWVCNKPVGAR